MCLNAHSRLKFTFKTKIEYLRNMSSRTQMWAMSASINERLNWLFPPPGGGRSQVRLDRLQLGAAAGEPGGRPGRPHQEPDGDAEREAGRGRGGRGDLPDHPAGGRAGAWERGQGREHGSVAWGRQSPTTLIITCAECRPQIYTKLATFHISAHNYIHDYIITSYVQFFTRYQIARYIDIAVTSEKSKGSKKGN